MNDKALFPVSLPKPQLVSEGLGNVLVALNSHGRIETLQGTDPAAIRLVFLFRHPAAIRLVFFFHYKPYLSGMTRPGVTRYSWSVSAVRTRSHAHPAKCTSS